MNAPWPTAAKCAACVAPALMLAAVVAGCAGSGGGTTSASSARRPAARAPCSDRATRPADPGTFVGDRVFFFGYATHGWRQGAELQSDPVAGRRRFSKVPVAVRGNAPARFRVPKRAPRVYITGWSRRAARDVTIRQHIGGACGDQRWRRYPGGFFFVTAQCLRLRVNTAGLTRRVPFGLRTSCPT